MSYASGLNEIPPSVLLDILGFGGTSGVPSSDIAVATDDNTTAVWSKSFPLHRGMNFAFEVAFTKTSGAVAVKVELEQSNQRPATEGATDAAWVIPDDKTTAMFASIADVLTHIKAYAPDVTCFGRLKITGLTGNSGNTKLHVARMCQIKSV